MTTPWATLQHANDTIDNPSPNTCVNVAPGTYTSGVTLTKGGNAATRTGYLAYRCSTPSFVSGNGCIITDNGRGFCFGSSCATTTGPNYVFIDGFSLHASSYSGFGQGIQLWNGNESQFTTSAHHVWIINNDITGYAQAGVQMNEGEYFYVIHNNTYANAYTQCGARGSGVSIAAARAISGYSPTADDLSNSMMGLYGPNYPFHIVVAWNVTNRKISFDSLQGINCKLKVSKRTLINNQPAWQSHPPNSFLFSFTFFCSSFSMSRHKQISHQTRPWPAVFLKS